MLPSGQASAGFVVSNMFGQVVAGSSHFGNTSVVFQAEATTLKLGLRWAFRLNLDALQGKVILICSSM